MLIEINIDQNPKTKIARTQTGGRTWTCKKRRILR